jgi:hypothetical protein
VPDSSSTDEAEAIGVTNSSARRRANQLADFKRFVEPLDLTETSIADVKEWSQTLPPRSRLTYVNVLLGVLKRRGIQFAHSPMLVRELKLEYVKTPPQRALITTPQLVKQILSTPGLTPSMHALTEMMHIFAARLTSLTGLHLEDIFLKGNMCKATFRSGKTILATGPYTLVGRLSAKSIQFLKDHDTNPVFPPPATCYRRLRRVFAPRGIEVRSFRRGTLQWLAQWYAPEKLLLISRHTSVQSLYNYLDSGQEALWEHDQMLDMNSRL